MKRGLKFILIVFCMLGIFSIGFVNASPLIPASASLNKFSSNYVTQQGNVKDTNDSNEVTYFGFLGGDHSNPFGNFEIIYNFSSMKDINNISYKRKFYAESTIVTAHTESISIFADGIWVNIYSNQNYNLCDGWTGICAECWGLYPDNCGAGSCVCTILPPVFYAFLNLEWKSITGNWKNVTAVKFSANYQVNDPSMENNGVIYYYLYEFQSFGVDSVPPVTCPDGFCNPATETCLNCPADCGTCPDVCLTPDDAIIKLSNSTNARGALWNDTNFIHDVCYSDIFGAVYSGANPHSCTGSNKILGLSDIADARAEIPSLNNYLTDVCYGDLDCISETGAGQCSDAARKVVARLSNQTNANLEQASNNNYNTKICCKSGVVPAGNIYWADMEETMINNVDLNALVKLMITGLSGGENIDYVIKKKQGLLGIDWLWPDSTVAEISGIGSTTWRAGKKSDETLSQGQYYFEASVNGGSWSSTEDSPAIDYRYLLVSDTENNLLPFARITGIKDRGIYFLDNLNFSQSSYDPDDDFTYSWDLGNGETREGDSISLADYNFEYAYSTPGQKDIVLTVTDSRGLSDRDKVSIIILDSSANQTLAYISKPAWDEFILNRKINFNATLSYAAGYIDKNHPVNCLAGNCPAKTSGCPPDTTLDFPDCQLDVVNVPANTPQTLENLYFNWTFINGIYPDRVKYYNGKGINGAITTADYDFPAIPSKPHKAILEVTY